jgi:hypothetical protein
LTPEIGAGVQRALEAAADQLFQDSAHASRGDRIADEMTPAQPRGRARSPRRVCACCRPRSRHGRRSLPGGPARRRGRPAVDKSR